MIFSIVSMVALAQAQTAPQPAPEFFASSERFGYTGTISVYATLADAQSNSNASRANVPVPQRDGTIYVVSGRPNFYKDFNAFMTAWYLDGNANTTGVGNPNSASDGFIQIYDADASNWTNRRGEWSGDKQAFTVHVKGQNAQYPSVTEPGDYARLWNAGLPGGGDSSKGTFIEYELTIVAKGLKGADPDGDGFFENTADAESYAGSFRGIFKNESATSKASNGYYVVDLVINSTSWAVGKGFARPDRFGSRTIGNLGRQGIGQRNNEKARA